MKHPEKSPALQIHQEKFNHALILLSFAILALSFQFSPKAGRELMLFLILSWLAFFISLLCGAWRAIYTPAYFKIAESLSEGIEEKAAQTFRRQLRLRNKVFAVFFRAQLFFFILGILLNGVFVTANYVYPPEDDNPDMETI